MEQTAKEWHQENLDDLSKQREEVMLSMQQLQAELANKVATLHQIDGALYIVKQYLERF